MLKGFIGYKNGHIPIVVDNYQMELFSNGELLNEFIKEYNFQADYILHGVCFRMGTTPQNIAIMVKESAANTCYVSCY